MCARCDAVGLGRWGITMTPTCGIVCRNLHVPHECRPECAFCDGLMCNALAWHESGRTAWHENVRLCEVESYVVGIVLGAPRYRVGKRVGRYAI